MSSWSSRWQASARRDVPHGGRFSIHSFIRVWPVLFCDPVVSSTPPPPQDPQEEPRKPFVRHTNVITYCRQFVLVSSLLFYFGVLTCHGWLASLGVTTPDSEPPEAGARHDRCTHTSVICLPACCVAGPQKRLIACMIHE